MTTYCTDENILVRAPGDAILLLPKASTMARGEDGTFDATGWVLSSPTVNMKDRGVLAGQVVILKDDANLTGYGPDGEAFLVDTVHANGSITLRRPGWGTGVGEPPGVSGNTVSFVVGSFGPQIEAASYRLNQLYGIDARVASRSPGVIYDPREIEDLCVLFVLRRLATDAWIREGVDLWRGKADTLGKEMDLMLPGIQLKWGSTGQESSGRSYIKIGRGN